MKELSLGELDYLARTLSKISIKKIDIPKNVRIPDWPRSAAPAKLKLGKREYLYPEIKSKTGFINLAKKSSEIEMTILENGAFRFSRTGILSPSQCRSDDIDPLERMRALFLFHQFKKEICEKLAASILEDADNHNEAVDKIQEALETFLPYLVADSITSWEE